MNVASPPSARLLPSLPTEDDAFHGNLGHARARTDTTRIRILTFCASHLSSDSLTRAFSRVPSLYASCFLLFFFFRSPLIQRCVCVRTSSTQHAFYRFFLLFFFYAQAVVVSTPVWASMGAVSTSYALKPYVAHPPAQMRRFVQIANEMKE